MVEDRVTDPRRIAELLASELTGRERGPLARVAVVDADRDADPTPEGTEAYALTVDGDRIGPALLVPGAVELVIAAGPSGGDSPGSVVDHDAVAAAAEGPGLATERLEEGVRLRIASGAAVKRAVDAVVAGL